MIITMARSKNPVQLQVSVTLNPQAMEFLEANCKNGDVNATLSGWAGYWVEQQARGGLMLTPEDHTYLAELNDGKKFRDSRALVRAVEKGLKREEAQYSFTIAVDPAHYPALKENAEAGGLTVEESLDGIVQMIFSNGWVYDFTPRTGRSIPFTAEMVESCKALCDKKSIDSSDISGLIAEGRFLPITRETAAKAKSLMKDQGKAEFDPSDLDALFAELEASRAELAALRKAPRELVAV